MVKDIPFDAGDAKQVKKRKTKRQLVDERNIEDLRKLLNFPEFRYFLWRLLSECKVLHTLSGYNEHNMAIASGKRDAGIWALDEIFKADKHAFINMQREAEKREGDK